LPANESRAHELKHPPTRPNISVSTFWTTLDAAVRQLDDAHGKPSAEEHERAQRFLRAEDRGRFLGGRALLRRLLSERLDTPAQALRFVESAHGKPELEDRPLYFNVSHSGERIWIAIASLEVGVDVERKRALHDLEAMKRRCFTLDEQAAFVSLDAAAQEALFYRLWTRKEAFLKAHGAGLGLSLQSFSVTTSAGVAALTRVDTPNGPTSRWTLVDLTQEPEYPAALVVDGSCDRVEISRVE
jgi:4'-phosphopantetheinyl transferase